MPLLRLSLTILLARMVGLLASQPRPLWVVAPSQSSPRIWLLTGGMRAALTTVRTKYLLREPFNRVGFQSAGGTKARVPERVKALVPSCRPAASVAQMAPFQYCTLRTTSAPGVASVKRISAKGSS